MTEQATLEDDLDPIEQQQEDADLGIFPTVEDRRIFLTRLKLLGATSVEIEFQGGGDSGEIYSIEVHGADGKEINIENELIRGWQTKSDFDKEKNTWVKSTNYVENMKLSDLLEALTYDALERTELDWYNNDGGQGSLSIDFTESPPAIELNVGINITETNDYAFNL